jgi:hypothetical protein
VKQDTNEILYCRHWQDAHQSVSDRRSTKQFRNLEQAGANKKALFDFKEVQTDLLQLSLIFTFSKLSFFSYIGLSLDLSFRCHLLKSIYVLWIFTRERSSKGLLFTLLFLFLFLLLLFLLG